MADLNADFFVNATQRINNIKLCSELQDFTKDIMKALNAQLKVLEDQISGLAGFADLLTAPGADLAKLATWAEKMITALVEPGYQAYLKLQAQLTALTAQIAQLAEAITTAASKLVNCVISIPAAVL